MPKIAPEVVPEVQTAPVAVQAAETHENHDACAAGVCNVDNHSSRHVTTEWTPVSSLSEIRGNGFYYLTQDVIQSGKWNVPASSNPGVILCLNGHKITLEKGGTYSNSGISVSSTNFILTDCPDKNGQVIQTTNDNAVSVGYWGDFYMFGGTITHADDVTGSGVYIIGSDAQNNSFKMYGGCITKNTAKNGGGIYVSNSYSRTSSVTIRSGSITANNATDNGGGVYLDGNVYFSMTGGSITNNTATQNGGGVYVDTDENRSFTLNSGSITDNKATQDGGGVYVNSTSKFNMSDASITGNSAGENGGGVYVGGTISVGNKTIINDNKGGTAQTANNVYLPEGKTIDARYSLSKDSDIGVTTTADLSQPGSYVSIATWTDTYSKHYADGFKSDIENEAYCLQLIEKYDVLLSNGVIHAHPVCGVTCGHTTKHERLYWTGISDLSEVTHPENTYYYLTDNVEVSSTWTPKDGTVLDLNGKNITATSGGAVIKVEDGVDFTLTDCKADNGTYDTTFTYGQITHKSGCEGKGIDVQSGGTFTMYGGDINKNGSQSTSPISSTIGCGVSVNGGTFYMYDGTINNNTMCVNEHGGGVDMTGGLFEMYGGKITYNTSASTSSGHGGGVAVQEGATFKLHSGYITYNKANGEYGEGGGVLVNGTFIMSGGSITNNSANNGDDDGTVTYGQGGGVCVGSNGLTGIFKVSGKATITQNWQNGGDISTGNWTNSNRTYNNVCLYKNSSGIATITIQAPDNLIYDGRDKSATIHEDNWQGQAVKDIKISYRMDGQAGDFPEGSTIKDAGTYIASITVGDETAKLTYAISPKALKASEVSAIPSGNLEYDGQDQTYTLAASNDYTLTNNVQKNAGTYNVTVALADKDNTQWVGGEIGDLTYSFKIDPKPVTVTAKDQVTRIGQPLAALTYTCDPAPCAGDSFTGELATNANKDQLSDQYTISQGDLSLGNNYTITFVPGKYTVTDKLPQPDFKFGDGLISKTYGDEPFTVAATGAAEGSTVSYTSDKTSVATVDSDGHVTIVGAGEATITATAAETADYVSASASYTLTVARAELTITAKNQSAYVGDAAPELGADSYTVTGLVNGESLTTALAILPTVQYVDENGQQAEPDMTKTGETVIRASGAAASGNYDLAYVDGKLTVSTRPSSGGGGGGRTPTYPVTTPSGVDSSKKSAAKGDVVTITVKPEPGFEVEEVIVTDAKGNQIKVTANADGTFSFIQPDSQVEVQTVYAEAGGPFRDVARSDYFYDAVTWAKDNNITGGVGDDLFGADRSCTRAQIVTFLWRAAGSPEPKGAVNMTDVPADAYYAKAVAWAIESGVTSGTGAGQFSPDATCTRAQGVTFLYRAAGSPAVTGSAGFQDVSGSDYFAAAVAWAKANDITDGVGNGLFGSKNSCTRAQIVTFLYLSQQA